jgi:muramidase (phage lysozyme)
MSFFTPKADTNNMNIRRLLQSMEIGEEGMANLEGLTSMQSVMALLMFAFGFMPMNDPNNPENAQMNERMAKTFGFENGDQYRDWHNDMKEKYTVPSDTPGEPPRLDFNRMVADYDFSKFDFDSAYEPLLDFIGDAEHSVEGDAQYNTAFGNKDVNFTDMTINEVIQWQRDYVAAGSPSSAAGKYQIIRGTLEGLKDQMDLTGNELFDEQMQDAMAIKLMEGRGLDDYLEGDISQGQFINRMAKEWASLPTTSGRGHYNGDGLNHQQVTIQDFSEVTAAAKHIHDNPEPEQTPTAVAANETAEPEVLASRENGSAASDIDPDNNIQGPEAQTAFAAVSDGQQPTPAEPVPTLQTDIKIEAPTVT